MAEHDFETVVSRNPLRRKDFRAARRRGADAAAATSRAARSSSTTARSPSSRWTTTATSRWSTSTATRSVGGCGSCPPGCWTSAVKPPHLTAARELEEEAGLQRRDWRVLVDLDSAPGFSDESVRVLPGHRADRRRPARGARRRSRPDGAVVSRSTMRSRMVLQRRDRQFHCGGRDSGRPRRRRDPATLRPVDAPWVDQPTAFARPEGPTR